MSMLSITPDAVAEASGNLQSLGSALRSANAAAASPTTAIAAPASDEVSAAITSFFGTRGQEFQALSARADAFHEQFVKLLSGGAAQYVNTELTNARQTLSNAVNAPAQTLLSQPSMKAAAAVAAANSTPFHYSYGPISIAGNQTYSSTATGFSGSTTATVTLNAVRPLTLFSGKGTESFDTSTGIGTASLRGSGPFYSGGGSGSFHDRTGDFAGNFGAVGPFFSAGGSLHGNVPVSGTGSPQITGLSLNVDHIPVPTGAITTFLNGFLQGLSSPAPPTA